MSKFEVFDRCDANAIRHDLALIAKRLRAAREERSLSLHDLAEQVGISEQQVRRMERGESDIGVLALARVARALEKDLDWFVSNVRTLQEHTEGLWRKNANVTRTYPAGFRFPAKKEILVDLGLWEPIGSGSAEKRFVIWAMRWQRAAPRRTKNIQLPWRGIADKGDETVHDQIVGDVNITESGIARL